MAEIVCPVCCAKDKTVDIGVFLEGEKTRVEKYLLKFEELGKVKFTQTEAQANLMDKLMKDYHTNYL